MNPINSDSLLSQLSSLSQLSNVSYRGTAPIFNGSQIFKQSLLPGQNPIRTNKLQNQQQIGIESLGMSNFKNVAPQKQSFGAFTFWTKQLDENIQGTSDNQHDEPQEKNSHSNHQPEEEKLIKIQEEVQKLKSVSSPEPPSQSLAEKAIKNETKNIPKNFGKAIIIFIEKNEESLMPITVNFGIEYKYLLENLRSMKKKINTIADLRNLWGNTKEGKCVRVLSNYFLRKHSLQYIYNSRIKTRICHAKYKRRLQEALKNPFDFNHIKEY